MTADKVNRYSEQIMNILMPFWTEVDQREHETIKKQIHILKTATASLQKTSSDTPPSNAPANSFAYAAAAASVEADESRNSYKGKSQGSGFFQNNDAQKKSEFLDTDRFKNYTNSINF